LGTDHPQIDSVDYLIIGQGLAGTAMAFHLIKAGKTVLVVDNGSQSSSKVAAGLFNPVTGRRFVKSWLIDDLLPYTEKIYDEIAKLTGADSYFHEMPIIRYLAEDEEASVFERSRQVDNQKYIAGFTPRSETNKKAIVEITGGGYVDTVSLINDFRIYLQSIGSFIQSEFEYKDLKINEENIKWNNISAGSVIFCEGYKAIENPYFPGLPFNLVKGEILTVRIPELNSEKILMSGGYLLPIGNDIYKLGSTYDWDNLSPEPTESGFKTLITKLKNITDLPFEVIDHEAGVRPAVKNRRPILGRSAAHEKMYILNGLGTKGVILAPYFAKQLVEYILEGLPLDKEVNVRLLP